MSFCRSSSLAAAARSGLALIWKIVLVVELIGRSSGVGFEIELNFQNFEIGMTSSMHSPSWR